MMELKYLIEHKISAKSLIGNSRRVSIDDVCSSFKFDVLINFHHALDISFNSPTLDECVRKLLTFMTMDQIMHALSNVFHTELNAITPHLNKIKKDDNCRNGVPSTPPA